MNGKTLRVGNMSQSCYIYKVSISDFAFADCLAMIDPYERDYRQKIDITALFIILKILQAGKVMFFAELSIL